MALQSRFTSLIARWRILVAGWVVLLLAYGLIFSLDNLLLQTTAAFIILSFAPGLFAAVWLIGRDPDLWVSEFLLYAIAIGYAIWIWVALFISYLPGDITQPLMLIVYGCVSLVASLIAIVALPKVEHPSGHHSQGKGNIWHALGIIVLLTTAFYFRFSNVQYSEFQGDEAKVMVHAVAAINGVEDVLFTYRKGPTEILLPVGQLALVGTTNEALARLPFAVANVVCILAVFLLGKRLFGILAGWLAAMLMVFDGYMVGYSRIVQYPSIIFLMSIFTLYPLARLAFPAKFGVAHKDVSIGYLVLAFFFGATAVLTHYEGIIVVPPALYLLWLIFKQTNDNNVSFRMLLVGTSVSLALLFAFYIPFVRHPYFATTIERYSTDVVGESSRLFNNLPLFIANGILYNSLLGFSLTLIAAICGIVIIFWRARYHRHTIATILLLMLVLAVAWLVLSSGDTALVSLLFVSLIVLSPLALPTTGAEEKFVWIWLAFPLLITFHFLKDPNTHFYIFYIPLLLIGGNSLAQIWSSGCKVYHPRIMKPLVIFLLLATFLSLGVYAHSFFIRAPEEVVRHWRKQGGLPDWLGDNDLQGRALFGIPHYSGWEVVQELFAKDVLKGSYITNVRSWIPQWYLRDGIECEDSPDVILLETLERHEEQESLRKKMGSDYYLWGIVNVQGEPRIEIHRKLRQTPSEVSVIDAPLPQGVSDGFSTAYEFTTTELSPPLTPIGNHFDSKIELTGYWLPDTEVKVGDELTLGIVWRGLQPMNRDYTAFLQILGPNDRMIGQIDIQLSCESGPTSTWGVGEQVTGYFRIPVFPDELPGEYSLIVGLYDSHTQDRLWIYSPDNELIGDAQTIATITVLP